MNFARERLVRAHRARKCETCRDRKVKCDNREPFCATCTTRGFICRGYVAFDAFIHVEPAGHASRRASRSSGTSTSRPPTSRSRSRAPALLSRQRQAAATSPSPVPIPVPTWTPDRVWNYREFFLSRLVGSAARAPTSGIPDLLCEFLNRPLVRGTMGYVCMEALTTSYYLMRTRGPAACQQGMRAYGRAIRAVQVAVDHPRDTSEADILMGLMSLCLYENIIVTRPRSWVFHYQGISKMIEVHGPDHYRSAQNRNLLLAFRYTIIISAGTLRQPCFLAEPAWTQAIQLTEAEARDPFETILNIAVDVPGLLHGVDRLIGGLLADSEVATLLMTLEGTIMALQEWRYTSFGSGGSYVSNPRAASAMAFYYMVFLLLEELCDQLRVPWLPALTIPPTPTPPDLSGLLPTIRAQHKHLVASQIVHLAEQSITAATGIYGILRFIMALHVAHDHLLPGSPEMRALDNLMNVVVAGEHGFQMARRHRGQYTSFAECLGDDGEELG